MRGFRDRTAVAGVGYTRFSRNSGVSTLTLACEAVLAALEDAGLTADDVDGIATHRVGDSAAPSLVGPALGLREPAWYLDQFGGGSVSHSVVGQAALAVAAGMADTVVCYRAINARSEFRMGGTGRAAPAGPEAQYQAPYGYVAPPQQYAMLARAHMTRYGTRPEHFGHLAVLQRANAVRNPRALMRIPITLDDYLASRWIAEPFRLLDCCLETDGACALVVTTAERAADLRRPPVLISAAAWGGGVSFLSGGRADTTVSGAAELAPRLYRQAGVGPAGIDVAEIYDCFTYSVIVQLEDYGFCAKGEGGPYAASGALEIGGELPVNTHGGFLSEGYVHGVNHIAEAVSQLRGDAGERQVAGAEVALSTAQPGYILPATSALIMRRG
ncbi:acetyl-CoA acetyltransferase [Streptosporangium becharense]|uniref:Acetyl-CoA acetyltransferase n=1 Tax=Streptosporangium becharense TaxID=1816182 RepID=A0A7W9MG00_9ACTN|nr:acetyl-CoA acetyltransferase [Streptosporangium becharense]MBB2912301.1 acetyl-CoA acetyltransferase [Streptosporangium becharense]MBB5818848.1 acetyl-CoA acetyltransferase [Streptosporangium becharense]